MDTRGAQHIARVPPGAAVGCVTHDFVCRCRAGSLPWQAKTPPLPRYGISRCVRSLLSSMVLGGWTSAVCTVPGPQISSVFSTRVRAVICQCDITLVRAETGRLGAMQACRPVLWLQQPEGGTKLGMCMSLQLFDRPSGPANRQQDGAAPLLAVGYEAGHIAVWDTGAPKAPLAVARLHEEPVLSLFIDASGTGTHSLPPSIAVASTAALAGCPWCDHVLWSCRPCRMQGLVVYIRAMGTSTSTEHGAMADGPRRPALRLGLPTV